MNLAKGQGCGRMCALGLEETTCDCPGRRRQVLDVEHMLVKRRTTVTARRLTDDGEAGHHDAHTSRDTRSSDS